MTMGMTSTLQRNARGMIALSVALLVGVYSAKGHDETKYPDLRGQWTAVGGSVRWIPDKPRGLGQEAPLTPEYQRIFEDNLADMAEGGQGTDPTTWCLSPGMPRVTNGYGEIEFVVTPETFHVLVFHVLDSRRIFTDGRDFPTDVAPSFLGISIGRWIDTKGDGYYDVLEAETRNMKGPRAFDASGLPLHADNQTIVKERYTFDKSVPDVISNEVTVLDKDYDGFWMKGAYRIPDTDNGMIEPGTAPKATVPINRFNVRSFITSVADGGNVKAGETTLKGIAFDGGSGIKSVDVSADDGKTWAPAKLGQDLGKYSFREWTLPVTLAAGAHVLKVRATANNGKVQPDKAGWNPPGYMRNVIEELPLRAV